MNHVSPLLERTAEMADALRRALDEADLEQAVRAYRLFHPVVCGAGLFRDAEDAALGAGMSVAEHGTHPRHVVFTASSDTPYTLLSLSLAAGPMVIEIPAGPLIAAAVDADQRWIADLGLAGPDAGGGGTHLILPPAFTGLVPEGPYVWEAGAHRVMVGVRALPVRGDIKGAIDRIRAVDCRPLSHVADWPEPGWVDPSERTPAATPRAWESSLRFWEVLHAVIESEPPARGWVHDHSELAGLGIAAGRPFAPDARLRGILEEAARRGRNGR
jgi:hypothetical protein